MQGPGVPKLNLCGPITARGSRNTCCKKPEGTLCNLLVQFVKLRKFARATFCRRGHTYLDIALRRRLSSPVLAVQLLLEVSIVPAVASSEVQRTSRWYTMTDWRRSAFCVTLAHSRLDSRIGQEWSLKAQPLLLRWYCSPCR
jgi:hypothetical protein